VSSARVAFALLFGLSVATASSGCDDEDPCQPLIRLQSGTGTAEPSTHLILGPERKSIEVDQANSEVIIRYVRDGEEVVETWRLSALSTAQR
jgi:hypothetical protein